MTRKSAKRKNYNLRKIEKKKHNLYFYFFGFLSLTSTGVFIYFFKKKYTARRQNENLGNSHHNPTPTPFDKQEIKPENLNHDYKKGKNPFPSKYQGTKEQKLKKEKSKIEKKNTTPKKNEISKGNNPSFSFDKKITSPPKKPKLEPKWQQGLIGLKNIGNTCYMNAALQCLIVIFTDILNENSHLGIEDWKDEINKQGSKSKDVALKFLELLSLSLGTKKEKNTLQTLKDLNNLICDSNISGIYFEKNKQQDSSLAFESILDAIIESIEKKEINFENELNKDSIHDLKKYFQKVKNDKGKSKFSISQYFSLYQVVFQDCTYDGCRNSLIEERRKNQIFLQKKDKKGAYIKSFQELVRLKQESEYKGEIYKKNDSCFFCKTKEKEIPDFFLRNYIISKSIVIYPRYLCFNLDLKKNKLGSKLQIEMNYPKFFELNKVKYSLLAATVHIGNAIHTGHYVAYIKKLDTQKFWLMNDKDVSQVENEDFLREKTPVQLTYRRIEKEDEIDLDSLYKETVSERIKFDPKKWFSSREEILHSCYKHMVEILKEKDPVEISKKKIENFIAHIKNSDCFKKIEYKNKSSILDLLEKSNKKKNLNPSWLLIKEIEYFKTLDNTIKNFKEDLENNIKEYEEMLKSRSGESEKNIKKKIELQKNYFTKRDIKPRVLFQEKTLKRILEKLEKLNDKEEKKNYLFAFRDSLLDDFNKMRKGIIDILEKDQAKEKIKSVLTNKLDKILKKHYQNSSKKEAVYMCLDYIDSMIMVLKRTKEV